MKRSLVAALLVCAVFCAAEAADVEWTKAEALFSRSVGRVYVYFKYDDGEAPGQYNEGYGSYYSPSYQGEFSIDGEQPLVQTGYLLAGDTVLTDEPSAEDRFIDRIEFEIAGARYKASIAKYAARNSAVLLKLSESVRGGLPLAFDYKAKEPYYAVNYSSDDKGKWRPYLGRWREPKDGADYGQWHYQSEANLLMTAKYKSVGMLISNVTPEDRSWKGSPLLWEWISAADYAAAVEKVRAAAERGLVGVTVKFRRQASSRWEGMSSYEDREAPTEMLAPGLALEGGKVLVLAGLTRRDTARVESISTELGGKSTPLALSGALAKFGALIAKYEGEIEGVTPLELAKVDFAEKLGWTFIGQRLSYKPDARYERFARARVTGLSDGRFGLLWPEERGNHFIYTLDGKLAAVPLAAREPLEMQEYFYSRPMYRGYGEESSLTVTAARLEEMLAAPDAIDPDYKPLSEEEEKRFVWLGVEMQRLTKELAKAKDAALLTRGGEIGGLVSHVYPDSPAAKAGVQVGDVLLRFSLPGQPRPVNVQVGEEQEGMDFPWAQLDQVPDMYFDQIPRPWPPQENMLNRFLTEVGAGKMVTATFVRGGRKLETAFTLELGPLDFNAAPSHEEKAAGLTTKDLTFEVRQFFKMKDGEPGVVISEIKKGSKASVAGLKPCEIITAADGKPIGNVDELKAALAVGGDIKLTVKRMSQTRVVKMSLAKKEATPQPAAVEPAEPAVEPPGEPAAEATQETIEVPEGVTLPPEVLEAIKAAAEESAGEAEEGEAFEEGDEEEVEEREELEDDDEETEEEADDESGEDDED